MYDILIIGAGITGAFIARDLSRYQLQIALLDREDDIACGASMANSAIIHSGHDPQPDTLKARLNVRGNMLYENICRELGVAFRRTSAFVAATSEEESRTLDRLERQARERRIPAFRLSREEALEKEPHLSDHVTEVLELPSTGIITPWEVAIALAEEAVMNGTALELQREVIDITWHPTELPPSVSATPALSASPAHSAVPVPSSSDRSSSAAGCPDSTSCYLVTARDPAGNLHTYETRRIIDAAGVYADDIYAMVSEQQRDPASARFTIRPRKGEYYVIDHETPPLVERVIYPVPSEKGKGVLVVPTIHDNLLIGPNSDYTDDKEDVGNTGEALAYVRRQIAKTVTDIPFQKVIRHFAGLRPSGSTHDFIIEEAADAPGFYLAAAIESPGLTAAPAISEYIIQELLAPALPLIPKEHYRRRRPFLPVREMTPAQYQEKIRENPAYGHIVCRCEQISEGEILDAIHRPAGARTIKGIRKRCRPGMGRCQGGFCEPLVTELLMRELSLTPEELLHIPSPDQSHPIVPSQSRPGISPSDEEDC